MYPSVDILESVLEVVPKVLECLVLKEDVFYSLVFHPLSALLLGALVIV